jgi:hypothetical protein
MSSGNSWYVTENCYTKYLGGSAGSLAAFITGICDMFDAVCTNKKAEFSVSCWYWQSILNGILDLAELNGIATTYFKEHVQTLYIFK